MKIKTSDLSGIALDWAVAKCEGLTITLFHSRSEDKLWIYTTENNRRKYYYPSSNWSQGGPIIEREEIELHVLPWGMDVSEHPTFKEGDKWEANIWPADMDVINICGETPLIAAMRCYVASKLGEEVEVPDELIKGE